MKPSTANLLFLANYILIICYMGRLTGGSSRLGIEAAVPMLLVTVVLTDITYIASCNVRGNRAVSLFCVLMALECWYMLLSSGSGRVRHFLFCVLCAVVWHVSVRFMLLFLFQGDAYRFGKPVGVILYAACLGTLTGLCISDRVFACMYGIQLLLDFACLLFLSLYHRSRVAFVLKSERKCLMLSAAAIAVPFLIYYFLTLGIEGHISNFGVYLPVLFFLVSIHGIIRKEHRGIPLSTVFTRRQLIIIAASSLAVSAMIIWASGGGYREILIAANGLSALLCLCNIVWEYGLRNDQSRIMKESRYCFALQQLQQEETLKTEFADFLHDEILQDLLSIKNLMGKSHRPHIQDLITETLESLNVRIRGQMQDYHPVILKSLTARENFQNLAEAVAQSFPQRDIKCSLDCLDSLFLVKPYSILVYRLIKELLTNVYKHTDGNRAWITLALEKDVIRLCVCDNGTGDAACIASADAAEHKGIASIRERVRRMDGTMKITDHAPHGISIQIQIPMKGDVSYQYFIS